MSKLDEDKQCSWNFKEVAKLIDSALANQSQDSGSNKIVLSKENNKLQHENSELKRMTAELQT